MKNIKGFFTMILIVAAIFVIISEKLPIMGNPVTNWDTSLATPIGSNKAAISVVSTPIPYPTPRPLPTYTLQPTQTPQPTYTPLPTYTPHPTPTVNLLGDFGPGAKIEQIFDVWFWNVFFFLLAIVILSLPYLGYKIYENEKDRIYYIRMEEIKVKQTEAEAKKPPARPIISNKTVHNADDYRISPRGKSIRVTVLKDFIDNVAEVGLAVTQWKFRPGWSQPAIENVLDWLSDVDLITPRSPGKMCEWKGEHGQRDVARAFTSRAV